MAQAVVTTNTNSITIADINGEIGEDGRVSHKRIASVLGMAQHHKFRHLIERNIIEFQRYGEVPSTVDETSKLGGRPGKVIWLNEGQSILAAVRSEAPLAPEVRYQVITAFIEHRRAQLDKPIHVEAHSRRTSTMIDDAVRLKTNIDRLEKITTSIRPASHPNLCAMVINGQPVWADLDNYDMRPGEVAVVMKWDGSLAVSQVDNFGGSHSLASVRAGVLPAIRSPHGGRQRSVCLIIGKVVGHQNLGFQATIQQASPKQIEHKPGRTIYKEKVLELIDRGMGNAEISRELGCCIETVSRLRRQIKDQDYKSPPFASPRFAPYRDRVIAMIKQGYGNAEIARTLGCHLHTVERRRAMMNIQARDLLS